MRGYPTVSPTLNLSRNLYGKHLIKREGAYAQHIRGVFYPIRDHQSLRGAAPSPMHQRGGA